MKVHLLVQEQTLPIPVAEAWDFFSSPHNLDAITPPELHFHTTHCLGEKIHDGQIITYRMILAPGIPLSWVTEIKFVKEGVSFIDEQRAGPYRFWHHLHTFEPVAGGTRMTDTVHYALPFGPIGGLAHALFVRRQLQGIFKSRREILERRFPVTGKP